MGLRISQLREFVGGALDGLFRHNPSALAGHLRARRYGTTCVLDTGVIIRSPKDFSCGAGCALYHGTYILNGPGVLQMGERSHLGAMCYVNVAEGSLHIGDDVAIGPHTSIIIYSNYYATGRLITDVRTQDEVRIGNNVFIGANCTILPGTRIQDNVVVGAGSVVRGELSSNTVYAGSPCRPIKHGWFEDSALHPLDPVE